jgi:hypothetical protein
VSKSNRQADGGSHAPLISANGRIVAIYSEASNFGSKLGAIFVRDRLKKTTEQVSLSSNGKQAAACTETATASPSRSARMAASSSSRQKRRTSFLMTPRPAPTTTGRTTTAPMCFVRDRVKKTTKLVSVATR